MNKTLIFTLTATMMTGCAEQQAFDSLAWEAPAQIVKKENINDLMAQAKWGDGAAYLKLADCYKSGQYGVPDFMKVMTMLSMAKEYGGISRPMEYISKLSEDDNMRMTYESMESLDGTEKEKGIELAERLISKGCAEGYALKGYALFQKGDSIEAMRMATLAAGLGSSMGMVLKYVIPFDMMKKMPDESILTPLTEMIPIFNLFIAEEYIRDLDEYPENELKAAWAYLRADQKGCLDRQGARWLLGYMKSGGELPLSENDKQRLVRLADYGQGELSSSEFTEPETEICDEYVDSVTRADNVEGAEDTIWNAEKPNR